MLVLIGAENMDCRQFKVDIEKALKLLISNPESDIKSDEMDEENRDIFA